MTMGLQEELAKMAEWMEQDKRENGEHIGYDKLKFPVEVSAIEMLTERQRRGPDRIGALVRVRPYAKDCGDKTYLGIYLGDLPLEVDAFYRDKSHKLTIGLHRNPAIFVPELKRVVWGCGSWWGFIEKPEDAERMITDESIAAIPYVQALKAMIEAEKAKKVEASDVPFEHDDD